MFENKYLRNVLISWVPLAIVTTALCGLIYVSVQQNYRQSANDPQIQLAEEVARELTTGQSPTAFIPTRQLQLENTLATYILIFDEKGKIVGSSVTLNGKEPVLPDGIFSATKQKGETRFTWEPQKNTRSALVVKYYKGSQSSGFVAVGRSIKEIEIREGNLSKIVFLGWVIALVASFASYYFLQKFK